MDRSCCICFDSKDQLIFQPCGIKKHKICKKCLYKLVESIPISEASPELKCQYPFEKCNSPKTYNDEIILRILKNRFFIYAEAKEKYINPDYTKKRCGVCNAVSYVITNSQCNEYMCTACNIINCTTCCEAFYCACYLFNAYNNPVNFNYFFPKTKKRRLFLTDYKFKNEELTVPFITKFLLKKFQEDVTYVACPVCDIKIERTEDCNAISHCHTEICNACGMFSNIGEKLKDHWSARGFRGCPRWYNDPCLVDSLEDFKCVEGDCHGHLIGNCQVEDHKKGLLEYTLKKKKKLLYHYLINTPKQTRDKVISKLKGKLGNLMPSGEQLYRVDMNSNLTSIYKDY